MPAAFTGASRLADHYAILGVDSGATQGAIKAAARRLMLATHPDGAASADAATRELRASRFRAVTDAHQVLGDPARRQAYDRQRLVDPLSDLAQDLVDQLLRRHRDDRPSDPPPARGADVDEVLSISLLQSVRGALVYHGARRVRVPSGINDGAVLRLAGQGGPGTPPGDLHLQVVIEVDEAGQLRREGDDLHLRLVVSWYEALRPGRRFRVPGPWGVVESEMPAEVARGGAEIVIAGHGCRPPGRPPGRLVGHVELLPPPADSLVVICLEAAQGSIRPRAHLEALLTGAHAEPQAQQSL